ncbi:ATP-binding protein [Robertkochia solimangrovi]|uniref:sensor histidine kinase n=1 Tax=Robertkochia solimangrovi TaxID=2213046 RepID=UPI00117F40C4|nr:ATP-binding protein [Robertkochia solimangrovi]TRZ42283.1 histidine kinase [Robertkochia solimangrovi]
MTRTIDQQTFSRLRRMYIIALSVIALSIITSQILIRGFLSDQEGDSRVINTAGRQRMLSQKITKEALLLSATTDSYERIPVQEALESSLNEWESAHLALQQGNVEMGLPGNNSKIIAEEFKAINPVFEAISNAVHNILKKLKTDPNSDPATFDTELSVILGKEGVFLNNMDDIVNQYDKEAKAKVDRLKKIEILILGLTLAVLLCEFIFIFWPTARAVKLSMQQLISAENKSRKMAVEADKHSQAKERSVQQLKSLYRVMDQTLLFARINPEGNLIHLGERFLKLFNFRLLSDHTNITEILTTDTSDREAISNLIYTHQKTGWQGEIRAKDSEGNIIWLDMSLIPFTASGGEPELLVICLDITKRVEAQQKFENLTKTTFEEKILHQKDISKQIIENQEQEQNRIAKDLHDGIGQMLTGLKFNLESIDMQKPERAIQKIEQLKEITTNIIKGVRTATFNLTPPELSDHGIGPALAKLTDELSRLTGKTIIFLNKTQFNLRLDSLIEINIYRITQEAINNAIKYSGSDHIAVIIAHSKEVLSINIEDNGTGFKPDKIERRSGDGGMGLTFMQERTSFINGRLFIESEPGKGTHITLNIPLSRFT